MQHGNDNRALTGATIHRLERPRYQRAAFDADTLDTPIAFDCVPSLQWLQLIDPSFAASPDRAAIDGAILLQAYRVGRDDPDRWISYSRNKNYYAERRRYLGPAITHRTVTRAIDFFEQVGWLENRRVAPSPYNKRQSTLRATPRLLSLPPPVIARFEFSPETIVMRERLEDDRASRDVRYRDTAATEAMRRNVETINDALSTVALDVRDDAPGLERDGPFIRFRKGPDAKSVCLSPVRLRRIFNGSWSHGGRFYAFGVSYQNMPKPPKEGHRPPYVTRADLTIDGEPVVECDVAQIHPSMIYAYLRETPPGDAYTVGPVAGTQWTADHRRDVFKTVFNTAINATGGRDGAIKAIAADLAERDERQAAEREGRKRRKVYATTAQRDLARRLHEAMEAKHPAIVRAGLFGSGIGLQLQRIDSDMIERVLLRLLELGIVALPIHDSIIVQARHAAVAAEILDAEHHRARGLLWARKLPLNVLPDIDAASIA